MPEGKDLVERMLLGEFGSDEKSGGTSNGPATFVLDKLDACPRPIMSDEVEQQMLDAIIQFKSPDKWSKWGLNTISEQGSSVLLHGPPGTGKTTIAKWAAKRVGKGFKVLDASRIESDGSPGSAEKSIRSFFADCRKRKNATIFMDECDQLLQARTGDVELSWQIATIETLMTEISTYKGFFIAATNFPGNLDEALDQRFQAIIHVKRPDRPLRLKLWKAKLPVKFPVKPDLKQLGQIADIDLNGRQIETSILNCGREAIRLRRKPTYTRLLHFAQVESTKHIERNLQ